MSIKGSVVASDGVKLTYEKHGSTGPELVLIHGWSGSRRYFDLNVGDLSKTCQVYAIDLRFHGESDNPSHGFHIARLAADLHTFLTQLDLKDATVLGTSMGCAIIWSYIELFGEERLSKAVFVDQAPLQNTAEDWRIGSKGCYDAASLTRLQAVLKFDFDGFAAGNIECCATLPLSDGVLALLTAETKRCSPDTLARLMADHTQLDWRPILPKITLPCLNLVGRQSGVFPPEGCLAVGEMIPDCVNVVFEAANHWLYLEEPTKFNGLVADFVANGNSERPKLSSL